MSKLYATVALGLALAMPSGAWAAPAPSGPVATPGNKPLASTAIAPKVTNKYVILCYTCGGNYPNHVATGSLGGYNNVWEWGSGCGGSVGWRRDSAPYFCAH